MKMDIKIVNINDIEDLILAKNEIETELIEKKIIEEKMSIIDFINKYAITDYVYMINEKLIPFKLLSLNKTYLFIADNNKDNLDLLLKKLKLMKYDINNKVEVNISDMLKDIDSYDSLIIYDKKYYK